MSSRLPWRASMPLNLTLRERHQRHIGRGQHGRPPSPCRQPRRGLVRFGGGRCRAAVSTKPGSPLPGSPAESTGCCRPPSWKKLSFHTDSLHPQHFGQTAGNSICSRLRARPLALHPLPPNSAGRQRICGPACRSGSAAVAPASRSPPAPCSPGSFWATCCRPTPLRQSTCPLPGTTYPSKSFCLAPITARLRNIRVTQQRRLDLSQLDPEPAKSSPENPVRPRYSSTPSRRHRARSPVRVHPRPPPLRTDWPRSGSAVKPGSSQIASAPSPLPATYNSPATPAATRVAMRDPECRSVCSRQAGPSGGAASADSGSLKGNARRGLGSGHRH